MILKSLEKYFISEVSYQCGHLVLAVSVSLRWHGLHITFSWCVAAVPTIRQVRFVEAQIWSHLDLAQTSVASDSLKSLLMQGAGALLVQPFSSAFLCTPDPQPALQQTSPTLPAACPGVGLFLIISLRQQILHGLHIFAQCHHHKRPSCLGQGNRILAPLRFKCTQSTCFPWAPGMFSVRLGFEDIFLLPFWFSLHPRDHWSTHRRPYS